MSEKEIHKDLLPHLFRQEYAKITAVLCRYFGLAEMETAEDIASDTFLKASEHWALNGVPENPAAWLYTVAKNKTKDYLKHREVFDTKVKQTIASAEIQTEFEFSNEHIFESQLLMIFAVCNPVNTMEAQIALALQILCGFSIEEIANAFMARKETIKKRLQRARDNLRKDNFKIEKLHKTEIKTRLEAVLKTLYLLFNEGYFSKTDNKQIRIELCAEATRLVLVLTENPLTNISETNALMALMCFQSSRLKARTGTDGKIIPFEKQDKKLWDTSLIEKGNYYLVNATDKKQVSKYHLEAAIAYWHTNSADQYKWQHILQLYNQLLLIEYSSFTALNRIFAFAKIHGNERAITEAKKLNLSEDSNYHKLLGYLYSDIAINKAIYHYKQAITLIKSIREKEALTDEINRLKKEEKT